MKENETSRCGKLLFGVFGEFLSSAGSARQVPDLGAVIYNNISRIIITVWGQTLPGPAFL